MKWEWDTEKLNYSNGTIPWFFGRKLGILGVDDSGKSTLRKLMVDCELVKDVKPTSKRERHRRVVIKENRANKKIAFSYIDDTAGDRNNYNVKKEVFKKVDYIIYVVRSEYILVVDKFDKFVNKSKKQQYITAIQHDFKHFDDWGKKNNFIIVGNYFGDLRGKGKDMVNVNPIECGVPSFSDSDFSNSYLRNFKDRLNTVINNAQIAKNADWIVGSLVSGKFANQLIIDILHKLMKTS
ncbi:MAG: hypothetical protein F6J98_14505 [Moorea sp. SIO4G2]|nr:hypothetical protein [Moorena sp. SIO4G2]